MKIIKCCGLVIFFTLLSFLFFINDVFAVEYTKNSDVSLNNRGVTWKSNTSHGETGSSIEVNPILAPFREKYNYDKTGYYFDLSVETDYNDNYYVFENRVNLRYYLKKETSTCESNTSFVLFKMEVMSAYENNEWNEMLKKTDFFQGMSVYISQEDLSYSDTHSKFSRCSVIGVTDGMSVTIGCPIKNTNISDGTLHIDFASEPWRTLSPVEGARRPKLNATVVMRDEIQVQCLDKPFLNASYTTNKDTAVVTIDTDPEITNYEFQLHGQTDYIKQTSNVITFDGLSNGTYILDYRAYYGEQAGTLNQLTIEITDSPLPVADFTLTQNGKNLIVDASLSYGVVSNISKYYFKLGDGEWEESSNPVKTYENLSYSNYMVYVKVKDSDGNMSSVKFKGMGVISPEETQKNFFDYVMDFFKGFFDDLTTMFVRLFIPEKETLKDYIDNLQESLTTKLGFIGESVSFIIEEFEYMIVEPKEFQSICLPKTTMPEQMGGLEIIPHNEACLTSNIMNNFSPVTTILKAICSLLFMGWFVSYCYSELDGVLHGTSKTIIEVNYK